MARMKFLCDADRCIECNGCVTAWVTPRVGRGVVWTPFHLGGWLVG
jgi:Fe-S-cluster-containing dehydrogenase component